jgi:hypothetical protein
MAGVLFNHYGENGNSVGIHTRPEFVAEIRQCAQELGVKPAAN